MTEVCARRVARRRRAPRAAPRRRGSARARDPTAVGRVTAATVVPQLLMGDVRAGAPRRSGAWVDAELAFFLASERRVIERSFLSCETTAERA